MNLLSVKRFPSDVIINIRADEVFKLQVVCGQVNVDVFVQSCEHQTSSHSRSTDITETFIFP